MGQALSEIAPDLSPEEPASCKRAVGKVTGEISIRNHRINSGNVIQNWFLIPGVTLTKNEA